MASGSRVQEYPYQYKSISLQNARDCGQGGTVNFNLPEDFIAAKNLYAHIRIQFDAAEPTANQKIIAIGQPTYPPEGAQPKMIPLNLSADANRRIDLEIDLTPLIPKLDVFGASFALYGQSHLSIGILHPNILSGFANIEIWKLDLVYTTQGIR